ncbi:LRRN4 C-terminal-like protein [Heterodontus francisci]|uniref:LRRN4 C-terminal-like protein n=1 Tax=Heterodontus francisci TaxID=7792 RepID=UPI00355C7D0D
MSIGLSAVPVLLVVVNVAGWGEMAPTSPSPGSAQWPETAQVGRELDLSSEKPNTVGTRTTQKGYILIEVIDDNYEDYEEEEATSEPTAPGPMDRCDYNPCTHMQVPCVELQHASPCLCPGISGEDVAPGKPRVRDVTQLSDSSASIHWCEPMSTVDGYRLVYGPLGTAANSTTQLIQNRSRTFTLDGLAPGTSYVVCAVASNQAGASQVSEGDLGAEAGFGPCITFTTTATRRLALYIALTIALLLLLVSSCVLLKYFCARRKKAASQDPSSSPGIGLRNPTYEDDKVSKIPS